MTDKLLFSWRDFDGDRQQVSFPQLEASDLEANFTAMNTEFQKWLAGNPSESGAYEILINDDGAAASSPIAQSASQAIVEYQDDVTGIGGYTKRLPFPNLAKAADGQVPPQPAFVVSGGLTVFNPLHTDYPLLVAAIETATVSPNGNSITITRIYLEE